MFRFAATVMDVGVENLYKVIYVMDNAKHPRPLSPIRTAVLAFILATDFTGSSRRIASASAIGRDLGDL